MDKKVIVKLEKFGKNYGEKIVIRNVDLEVYEGEFLTLLGSSGCGKTTILRSISGLDHPSKGRVYIDGEEKNFTTKEFDLLTFLAENPNHVFTKEELFREIWDMDSVGDIATVTVHIKKIREKIEVDTAKPQYIETIWGVGYRFKI